MSQRFYSYALKAFHSRFWDTYGRMHLLVVWWKSSREKPVKSQNEIKPEVKRFSLRRGRHWDRKRR